MAQTVISSATSFATPTDIQARFDQRDLAQWVSDTGAPVTVGSLGTNANLLAALADASGMIESACLAADRYSPADLQNLAGGVTVGGAFLKRLTCNLAIGMLIERRPYLNRELPKQYDEAIEWLERLRAGKRIFGFQESGDAGNPNAVFSSYGDVQLRSPTVDQSNRFFGDRAWRHVPGPFQY